MFLDLHLTSKCNLRCKHCYLSDKHKNQEIDMDFKMFKNIVDNFMEINKDKKSHILLSGGEVTAYPRVEDAIKYIKDKYNKRISIASNGYKVIELAEKGIFDRNDHIQLSVDGDNYMHNWMRGNDNYGLIIKTLKFLQSNNINSTIYTTVHSLNKHTIPFIAKLAKKYGCLNYDINFYHDINNQNIESVSIEDFMYLKNYVDKKFNMLGKNNKCYLEKCNAGIGVVTVLPDGTYWDCSRSQNVIGKYPEKIENVIKKSKGYINPKNTCMKKIGGN